MLEILKQESFKDYFFNGFVETGISLGEDLIGEIRDYYAATEAGRNDFPKFVLPRRESPFIEGEENDQAGIKRFYDKYYKKAVYCEQHFMARVLETLLDQGIGRLFRTRYLVASYDIFLCSNAHNVATENSIHFHVPNLHHFHETECGLSIFVPLVDLDWDNGGRISVLPEGEFKVSSNISLKLLRPHFTAIPEYVDDQRYVVPDLIGADALAEFADGQSYDELIKFYKSAVDLARAYYPDRFRFTSEKKGKVLLFCNKNMQLIELRSRGKVDREVYIIRLSPSTMRRSI